MSLPLLHAGRTNPGPSAALDLRFALDKSLTAYRGPTPSFSRASTGTYFNSSGVLTTAAINGARFDHTFNGTSWVSRGLLVEEQRTNTFQWSEDFSNAFWTKLNASIATSSGTSPDGTNTANKITDDSTNGTHRIYRGNLGTAGQPCTTSFYLKAGTARYAIVLNSDNNDWRAYAVADLQTGTITQNGVMVAATGASYIGSSITNCGDGWYRVSVSGTNQSGDANYYGQVALSNSATPGTIPSYIGTGSYIYAVMAQMELNSSFPTSYIKTTSSTVTRSADVCQITGSDFSGFYNASEGSIAVDFDRLYVPSSGSALFSIRDALNNNAIYSYINNSQDQSEIYTSGAVATFNFGTPSSVNILSKITTAYKVNDFAGSRNGSAALTDSSGAVPVSPTYMVIGDTSGSAYLNGHIARLRYFNKRLPNATLQQLSDPDPTLNLQFSLNKTLTPVAGPAPSFSRASTGTYFNASGVLTSASINTPRFDHVYSGGQWVSKGLLVEEQRTNSITSSASLLYFASVGASAFIQNSTTGPDGTMSAVKVVSGIGQIQQAVRTNVATGAAPYTWSVFAKTSGVRSIVIANNSVANQAASFDIISGTTLGAGSSSTATIQNVGNGWFRIAFTSSVAGSGGADQFYIGLLSDDGSTHFNGDGVKGVYLFGAQAESGAFMSSFISTGASALTRSADVCQITGTSFGWMWNQGEGTVACEFDSFATIGTATYGALHFSDGGLSNYYRLMISGASVYSTYRTGGVSDATLIIGNATNSNMKAAYCFKLNDVAGSLNGAAVVTDTSVAAPVATQLEFSRTDVSGEKLNGHIAKLVYYPARLTNTKLQQLST